MAEQNSLHDMLNRLPEDLQKEVRDFAEFLLYKHQQDAQSKVVNKWTGILTDEDEGLNSVELQHKITHEWRDEDIT